MHVRRGLEFTQTHTNIQPGVRWCKVSKGWREEQETDAGDCEIKPVTEIEQGETDSCRWKLLICQLV